MASHVSLEGFPEAKKTLKCGPKQPLFIHRISRLVSGILYLTRLFPCFKTVFASVGLHRQEVSVQAGPS